MSIVPSYVLIGSLQLPASIAADMATRITANASKADLHITKLPMEILSQLPHMLDSIDDLYSLLSTSRIFYQACAGTSAKLSPSRGSSGCRLGSEKHIQKTGIRICPGKREPWPAAASIRGSSLQSRRDSCTARGQAGYYHPSSRETTSRLHDVRERQVLQSKVLLSELPDPLSST